jgi:hypothetical protein
MKKIPILLILLLALLSLGADTMQPVLKSGAKKSGSDCTLTKKTNPTVRVTVINKSGVPIEVRMTGKCWEKIYYARLGEGDRINPTEKYVDVIQDVYTFEIFFIELWDPVYGYECGEGTNSAEVNHSTRLTVLECSNKTPNNGERPTILKYPQGRGRGGGFRRR